MGELNGKIAVISGGSRGIGLGIAESFAREGAQTVLLSSSADNLKNAAAAVAKHGPAPVTVTTDLRTLEGCQAAFQTVSDRFGRCDILINNAGATRSGNFLALDDALWVDGFALKFFGAVRLARAFWPMLAKAQGHVVNIIGGAARTPSVDFMIGGSVNSAVSNFTKSLSQLGKKDGVNVNAIHPGTTVTQRMLDLRRQRAEASGRSEAELEEEDLKKSGIRRFATVEDVAELTLFLCTEKARQIQGVAIAVDGGATPGLY